MMHVVALCINSYFLFLFKDVLWHGGKKESVMKTTIKRLPVNLAVPFLTEVCLFIG